MKKNIVTGILLLVITVSVTVNVAVKNIGTETMSNISLELNRGIITSDNELGKLLIGENTISQIESGEELVEEFTMWLDVDCEECVSLDKIFLGVKTNKIENDVNLKNNWMRKEFSLDSDGDGNDSGTVEWKVLMC